MISRRSVLALGFITMGSVFALQAHAQGGANPALSFYPAGGWNASQASGICNVQTEYNNGFNVAFSGKAGAIQALNVDFQQDIFEAGKIYEVGFRIPGQTPNKFSARADSTRALNINVNNGSDMANALKTASAFDLNVEGNDFRFFMTGYANGAGGFSDCIARNKPAIPVNQITSAPTDGMPPPPPPIDPNAPVEAKANTVPVQEIFPADEKESNIVYMPAPRERMSEKIDRKIQSNPDIVKVSNDAPTADADAPAPILRDVPRAAEPLPEPIKIEVKKETKKQTTEMDITSASALTPSAPPPVDITELAHEPEMKAEKAPTKIEEPAPILAAAPVKPAPTVVNRKSPAPVVNRTTHKGDADFTNFANTEPSGNAPFAEPVSSNSTSPRRADPEMLHKMSELEQRIAVLQKENAELSADFSSTVHETKTERMSISSENWNLERATMRYNEAEREVKRLGTLLQQERAQCGMEKQDLEAQLFDPQVTSQQQMAKLGDLERKLVEGKEKAEQQRQQYEERIRILEGQKAAQ